MAKFYKVLAGSDGNRVNEFLKSGYFAIDYDVDFDLSNFDRLDQDKFKQQLVRKSADYAKLANKLWRLYSEFQVGDILLLFVRDEKHFRIGVIESEYVYQPGRYAQRRLVDWNKYPPVDKENMSVGLQNSVTGPVSIASLEKRSAELSHLIFGTHWSPEEAAEEAIVDDEAAMLSEATARESTKHHIYVYTYNHYITHPVRDADENNPLDRTYYKIGMTTRGYDARVASQETTAFPEPILLVRAYRLSDEEETFSDSEKDTLIKDKESAFHLLLTNAGHTYPKRKNRQGKEWFLTNLSFLDSIAEFAGMEQISID